MTSPRKWILAGHSTDVRFLQVFKKSLRVERGLAVLSHEYFLTLNPICNNHFQIYRDYTREHHLQKTESRALAVLMRFHVQ